MKEDLNFIEIAFIINMLINKRDNLYKKKRKLQDSQIPKRFKKLDKLNKDIDKLNNMITKLRTKD